MKKVLLGTSALVAAGMVAGQVQASDPLELTIGGYQYWGMYLTNNDDNGPGGTATTPTAPSEPGFLKGDHNIVYDGEIHFNVKTVLDNGLEVGFRYELEGEHQGRVFGGDQMDETFAWIEGSFGEFQIGNKDSVAYQMATAAPYVDYLFSPNSPYFFANGLSQFFTQATTTLRSRFSAGAYATFATFPNYNFDDAGVYYFTPVFNGFQFGVSYQPNNREAIQEEVYLLPVSIAGGPFAGAGFTPGASGLSPSFTHGEVYSVGGRYDGEIGDFGLTLAGGYTNMANKAINNSPLPNRDSDGWNAGAVIYYGNWGFGGSYQSIDDWHNVGGTDMDAYDVGLTYYSDGPWSAGISWLHEDIDYAAGNLVAGRAVTDEFDAYRLQGAYDLGPGIALSGAIGRDEFNDGAANKEYDTTFVGAGLRLNF